MWGANTRSNAKAAEFELRYSDCFDYQTENFRTFANYTPASGMYEGTSTVGLTEQGRTYSACLDQLHRFNVSASRGTWATKAGATAAGLAILLPIGLFIRRRYQGRRRFIPVVIVDPASGAADSTTINSDMSVKSIGDRLQKLQQLLNEGKISEREYVEARLRVISE
jgi:hypothetical protein